jgi:hypothetical protein
MTVSDMRIMLMIACFLVAASAARSLLFLLLLV